MKHGLPASTVAQVHGVLSRHPEAERGLALGFGVDASGEARSRRACVVRQWHARGVEGASNYFVDERWCSCRCAARRFARSGGRGRRLTFVTISHNFVS
jgi:hypothetical protein